MECGVPMGPALLPGEAIMKRRHFKSGKAMRTKFALQGPECSDFWLPLFAPPDQTTPPPIPRTELVGNWSNKTKSVSMMDTSEEAGFVLTVVSMASVTPALPVCHCPVCCIVERSTLRPEKNGVKLENLELVVHGVDKYTIIDKTKPWVRENVQGCTNPKPLMRRMPELLPDHDDSMKVVYTRKMMPPGKIIKDVRKDKTTKKPAPLQYGLIKVTEAEMNPSVRSKVSTYVRQK
ncbi:uncharacterized protein [Littorina saxatilis]|uniref:Uncharacterized protein n=1 Tax=Littorina saxatilis TaxID=31220 RepID=A0AAN9BBA6_9CAEN